MVPTRLRVYAILQIVIFLCVPVSVATAQGTLVLDNGLAPPNPENVIDGPLAADRLYVRDADCQVQTAPPCPGLHKSTTVAFVEGGSGDRVYVNDSSVLEMRGGTLGVGSYRSFYFSDQSRGVLSGGLAYGTIYADGASDVEVSGGLFSGGIIAGNNAPGPPGLGPHVEMTGGNLSAIYAYGFSSVRVDGGRVRGELYGSYDLFARNYGRIVITGGVMLDTADQPILAHTEDQGVIEFIGRDFRLDGVEIAYGLIPQTDEVALLTGILASGEALEIEIDFARFRPRSTRNVFVLPEPTPLPDADGDGIPDRHDFCRDVPDETNADLDLNYIGDACNDAFDADGDEVEDDTDTCPYFAHPDQRDTDGNGIGDVCNDAFDADGDEFEDDSDKCPDVPDPLQVDGDSDGVGDLCDPYPTDRENIQAIIDLQLVTEENAMLSLDLETSNEALAQCLDRPLFVDEDGDGEYDPTDACSSTEAGAPVDASGCSQMQFCEAISIDSWSDAIDCLRADWRNDGNKWYARDCRYEKVDGKRRCVAMSVED